MPWRWQIPLIGCNFAYRDFPITQLVSVDRMTVAAIRRELGDQPPWPCWTKQSSLELPPGWQHLPTPGIDSGSFAVWLALSQGHEVLVIGADGICGGSTVSSYHYSWHPPNPQRQIHRRHLQTLRNLTEQHPGQIKVVWDQEVQGLETVQINQALEILGKYTI